MKIGILTHHYINNYGAFLQAYALQKAVKSLYPSAEVDIIDMVNIKHFAVNTLGWFRIKKDKDNFKTWKEKIKVPGTFSKARKKHLKMSKKCVLVNQVNSLKYDFIIIGSDEVWNFLDKKSFSGIKFGIGIECEKVIAYAPSVGKSTTDQIPESIIKGMKKFSSLSARDNMTSLFIKKATGKKSTDVLDPTFLTDFPVEDLKGVNKPYFLFYYCDNLPERIKIQIYEYAKKNGYSIYGAGESDINFTDSTINLTPFEWVEMFRRASYVFTGTFHGAVFSILNKKPFNVYLTNESRIKKVNDLLMKLNITGREIHKEFVFDYSKMADSLNYENVYKIIEHERKKSIDFLKKSIK